MAKTLLEEAIEDARVLKQSAIENAKNVLVEAISPNIKKFVESQLGECMPGAADMHDAEQPLILKVVAPQGLQGGLPGMEDESAMYEEPGEEHQDDQQDVELMKKLGVLGGEEDGESGEEQDSEEDEDNMDEMNMPEGLELEAKDEDKEDKDDKKMDEVVEITSEELKEALSEVLGSLKKEAKVSKGFGAMGNATLQASGGPADKGIADVKSGEHQWKDETPPAAKDWTVKEAKQYVKAVMAENASIKKEAEEYKKAFNILRTKLQEVNLFNSKLLYTQKLLNASELTNKQRIGVIEAFDKAGSMREVELVYKTFSESFKIAGVVLESKKEQTSKAKASRLSAPSSTVLKEALVKENKEAAEGGGFADRMSVLAGLSELE